MSFEQYWTIFIKQWRLIVICFVFVGLGAYIGSRLITPTYQSTALVQVAIRSLNNQSDYNSLLASDQLVQTEAQLAVSDPVLREVVSHYPGLTVEQLSKAATSTPKPNTQLFEIAVLDASPIRAAALANDIAATLIKQQLQVVQQDNSQSQQQIQQDLISTRHQIDSTTTQIAALQAQSGNQAQRAVLQAELTGLQQHYSQWQTVLAQLELTQAQSGDFLRVAQPAQPEPTPVRPNLLLNTAAGFLAGWLLGILLALTFEQLDTRVRTEEALSQLLDWSVLATIWFSRPSKNEALIHPRGRNINTEAYRILRTNIGFSAIDKPLRTLLVTSPLPRDGKSVVAANLAIFMAKAGKNTLLIDADLRRPTLHEKFGISADKRGLSNAILACSMQNSAKASFQQEFPIPATPIVPSSTPTLSTVSLDPFVHATDIPNLYVMPSGPLPPNPSELLDSKAMQRFLAALSSCEAEVVIFDTSPLLGLSDTSILVSKVDATLVVADITRANKGNLKQTKALLTQASARVLGCVVNKQRRSRNNTPYSYYYYSTDERNSTDNDDVKNRNASVVSPITPDALKPKLDIQDAKTAKTVSIHSLELETPPRLDVLDGRKGG